MKTPITVWLYAPGTAQAGQVILPQPTHDTGIPCIGVSLDVAEQWRKLPRTPENEFKRYAGTAVALYAIHHLGA